MNRFIAFQSETNRTRANNCKSSVILNSVVVDVVS